MDPSSLASYPRSRPCQGYTSLCEFSMMSPWNIPCLCQAELSRHALAAEASCLGKLKALFKSCKSIKEWFFMLVIPAAGKQWHEDYELKAWLGHIASLKKHKPKSFITDHKQR